VSPGYLGLTAPGRGPRSLAAALSARSRPGPHGQPNNPAFYMQGLLFFDELGTLTSHIAMY